MSHHNIRDGTHTMIVFDGRPPLSFFPMLFLTCTRDWVVGGYMGLIYKLAFFGWVVCVCVCVW